MNRYDFVVDCDNGGNGTFTPVATTESKIDGASDVGGKHITWDDEYVLDPLAEPPFYDERLMGHALAYKPKAKEVDAV